jgi:hypothetical protein
MSRSKRPEGFTCSEAKGVRASRSLGVSLPSRLRLGQDLLKLERIDVHHAVLQQMEAQHRDLVILAAVAGKLAAAGKEDELVGAAPWLDDVQPLVNLAA